MKQMLWFMMSLFVLMIIAVVIIGWHNGVLIWQ